MQGTSKYGFDLLLNLKCMDDVVKLVKETFSKKRMALGIAEEDIIEFAHEFIQHSGFMNDINQFAKSDPAAKGSCSYVYNTYKGVEAIMHYRVAKAILNWDVLRSADREIVNTIVRDLCEQGKVKTGIDIHPFANIGEGCVIDHGVGTRIMSDSYEGNTVVIGETTIIGKNCTILNDVVIGASDVNQGQSSGRRHPKIGDNVTICAGAKILGRIDVGDNVFIGPGCRIIHDIPSNTKVVIINQLQIMKIEDTSPIIFDGVVFDGKHLLLYGENIKDSDIMLVDEQYKERKDLLVTIIKQDYYCIAFKITKSDITGMDMTLKNFFLKVTVEGKNYFIRSDAITRFLKKL